MVLLGSSSVSAVESFGTPISALLFDVSCQFFSIPGVEGFIGYQLFKRHAIVIGNPVCAPQDISQLTRAFHAYAQERDWTILYLLASKSFGNWSVEHGFCQTMIQVGKEGFVDPTQFQARQKLRWKVNQAIHSGVKIKETQNPSPDLLRQLQGAIRTWLNERNGFQIHLGSFDSLVTDSQKRIFYATHHDTVVGVLALSPIRQGWVMSGFLALSHGPVGTSEHLICTAIQQLAEEECTYLCLGVVAGSQMGKMVGIHPLIRSLAHVAFRTIRWLFHLDSREIYFDKFHPSWEPTYLLCSGRLSLGGILALKMVIQHA